MRAAGVDHEHAIRRAINPDSISLLKFGVDAEGEFRGISNFEKGVGLEKSAGKKESEESQKPRGKKCRYAHPDQASPASIDVGV